MKELQTTKFRGINNNSIDSIFVVNKNVIKSSWYYHPIKFIVFVNEYFTLNFLIFDLPGGVKYNLTDRNS